MDVHHCCRLESPGLTNTSRAPRGLIRFSQEGVTQSLRKRKTASIHVFPGALVCVFGTLAFDHTAPDAADL